MAIAEKSKPTRLQVDLMTFFEWMLLVALFCVAIAGGGRDVRMWYRFASLPMNDAALKHWCQQQDLRWTDVVRRDNHTIEFRHQQSIWLSREPPPKPPWRALGYHGLTSNGIDDSVPMRRNALPLMIGVICILAISWLRLRRR